MPVSQALRKIRNPDYTNPQAMDSQGLEMPPEVMALISSLLVPGFSQGAGSFARQIPSQIGGLSEAGAIFPEGAPLEALAKQGTGAMQELGQILPDAQKAYRLNEAASNWHAGNYDWPRVLQDKWRLLMNAGGN